MAVGPTMSQQYTQNYGQDSPAVNDLGLGDILKQDLLDEEEKRKMALKSGAQTLQTVQATQPGGILSPATMALFSGAF